MSERFEAECTPARCAKRMDVWAVYDHPKDYPDRYAARRFEISLGRTESTDDLILAGNLDDLRRILEAKGLFRLERYGADDPVIIETWL